MKTKLAGLSLAAVAAFGAARVVELAAPSTPEAIYNAIGKVRGVSI